MLSGAGEMAGLAQVKWQSPARVGRAPSRPRGRRLAPLEPLAGLPVQIQISLDRPDPEPNDEMRGPQNFAKVVAAIPELVARGSACGSPPRSRIRRAMTPTSASGFARCTARSA